MFSVLNWFELMYAEGKEPTANEGLQDVKVGLIGSGIGKSLSPAMHMQEGRARGLRYKYELIDLSVLGGGAELLPDLVDQAERKGFSGLNITHPCKQMAVALVDELSQDAAILGAINTIVFSKGRRTGHNTDWWGFLEGFNRGLRGAATNNVVLLGAGGAGVAVAHALALLGTRAIHVSDPDLGRTLALIDRLAPHHPLCSFLPVGQLPEAMAEADGIVHATPIGMIGHPGLPFDITLLRPRQWVAEIVYFPLITQLLSEARAIGCRTADGGGMAVFQAVRAFELFTGLKPDADRMTLHFRRLCGT